MNCCDEYGDCNQGRDCPIRKGYVTRRCRAGKPVEDDLPVQYWPGHEDDGIEDQKDMVAVAIALFILIIVGLVIFMGFYG